jgi:putative ABC transport system ATP-binding protein
MPETPPPSAAASRSSSLKTAELHSRAVSALAHRLNAPVDPTQVSHACSVALGSEPEPLAVLIRAAALVGLRVQPFRMSLADATWKASDSEPLVAWLPDEQRWLLLIKHSFFRIRVCDPSTEEDLIITRGELARRMGLTSFQTPADFAVVTRERPAEGLRGKEHDQAAALLPTYHGHGSEAEHHHHESAPRRFIQFLKPETGDVVNILLLSVVSGVLFLAMPLAVNSLVSNLAFGTESQPFLQALVVLGAAVFAFLLLSALIRGLQLYLAEVVQRRLFVRVAADMAYRLPRVRADSLDGQHAPELVNRFLDVVTLQKSTALLLLDGVNLVLASIIGLTVLGFYHPFLLSFAIVMLLALVFIIYPLGRKGVDTSIKESRSKYDMVGWLEELARYPRLFKGPGGYAMASDRSEHLAQMYLNARKQHFRVLLKQYSGLLLLEVLASSVLLLVGGLLVLSNQLTLGQLVASELIISAVVASIAKLGKQFEAWYDAMAAVDKLGHLADLQIETEDGDIPKPTLEPTGMRIEAKDLAFAYPDGREIFSGLSFCIHPGERVPLLGSQGSGCSTLLDLLLSLHRPASGYITIDGIDTRSWYLEELRASVMLLRSEDIVSGTIAENIRLTRADIGLDAVQAALKAVNLEDEIMQMPDGMHTRLLTGGLPLSSRQRVRLLLARALVFQPRLLLIDDLFDGLDVASMGELMDTLTHEKQKWTLIVTTRQPEVINRCRANAIDLDAPRYHTA